MNINMNVGCSGNIPISSFSGMLKNVFKPDSFFRSVLDSICKFFTGHPTEATQEKKYVQQAINNAIIASLKDEKNNSVDQKNVFARNSLDISIGEQKITLQDACGTGVALTCEGTSESILITTNLKVQDLINYAAILNGGGDIDTNSVMSKIGEFVINDLEQQSLNNYKENCIFNVEEPATETDDSDFPLLGSVNGKIHLCREMSLNYEELESTLEAMKNHAKALKVGEGETSEDHTLLMVLGIHKLKTRLPFDSEHYVLAAVSSREGVPPLIVDSKDAAVYPKTLRVLRSGHQKATDTVSCGAHSLRAMNYITIQLASGKDFSELMPPPAYDREICNNAIDVNKFITDFYEKRKAEMRHYEKNFNPDTMVWEFPDD